MVAPDSPGDRQALVGVGRGHADVHHGDVGAQVGVQPVQLVGVCGLTSDVEAGIREQPREALAEEQRVVADDYSHGSSALTVVPALGGLWSSSVPSRAATLSASPRRPLPALMLAPPLPSSRTSTVSPWSLLVTLIDASEARACLAALVSASATM